MQFKSKFVRKSFLRSKTSTDSDNNPTPEKKAKTPWFAKKTKESTSAYRDYL